MQRLGHWIGGTGLTVNDESPAQRPWPLILASLQGLDMLTLSLRGLGKSGWAHHGGETDNRGQIKPGIQFEGLQERRVAPQGPALSRGVRTGRPVSTAPEHISGVESGLRKMLTPGSGQDGGRDQSHARRWSLPALCWASGSFLITAAICIMQALLIHVVVIVSIDHGSSFRRHPR